MNKIKQNIEFIIIAVALSGIVYATEAFTKIELPRGVSIELPKNWVIFSGEQRITLDLAVKSVLDLSGIGQANSDFPFAANYYDDNSNTTGILNLRYYPQLELAQADARALTAQDINKFDSKFKELLIGTMAEFGTPITNWIGTQKININGITILLTEYHRNSQKNIGTFRVKLLRVFHGDKSFTLTISYLDPTASFLKPIVDGIMKSLTLESDELSVPKKSSITTTNQAKQNSIIIEITEDGIFLNSKKISLMPDLNEIKTILGNPTKEKIQSTREIQETMKRFGKRPNNIYTYDDLGILFYQKVDKEEINSILIDLVKQERSFSPSAPFPGTLILNGVTISKNTSLFELMKIPGIDIEQSLNKVNLATFNNHKLAFIFKNQQYRTTLVMFSININNIQ